MKTMVLVHSRAKQTSGRPSKKSKMQRAAGHAVVNTGRADTCGTRLGLSVQVVTKFWDKIAKALSLPSTRFMVQAYIVRDDTTGLYHVARNDSEIAPNHAEKVEKRIRDKVGRQDSTETAGLANPIRADLMNVARDFLHHVHSVCTNDALFTWSDADVLRFVAPYRPRRGGLPGQLTDVDRTALERIGFTEALYKDALKMRGNDPVSRARKAATNPETSSDSGGRSKSEDTSREDAEIPKSTTQEAIEHVRVAL